MWASRRLFLSTSLHISLDADNGDDGFLHAHIHLIPMQNEKDMLFSNPKLKLTDEEFKAVAEAIRAVL